MEPSLTVLLPVHNAPHRLAENITQLLEVLPDCTSRFDVLIIDDGSTDETGEVAQELAARFPQVHCVRHGVRLGLTEALQTGLDYSDGEIVLVGDERRGLNPDELTRLWRLRDDPHLVLARETDAGTGAATGRGRWIETLVSWGTGAVKPTAPRHAGVQMIRRDALERMQLTIDGAPRLRTDRARLALRNAGRRPTFLQRSKRLVLGE